MSVTTSLEELLLSFGGGLVALEGVPESYCLKVYEEGRLFLPRPFNFRRSVAVHTLVTDAAHVEGTPCGIRLLRGPQHECLNRSVAHHLETGDDLCLGFVLAEGVWLPHVFCWNREAAFISEPTFQFPGALYMGVLGRWDDAEPA